MPSILVSDLPSRVIFPHPPKATKLIAAIDGWRQPLLIIDNSREEIFAKSIGVVSAMVEVQFFRLNPQVGLSLVPGSHASEAY